MSDVLVYVVRDTLNLYSKCIGDSDKEEKEKIDFFLNTDLSNYIFYHKGWPRTSTIHVDLASLIKRAMNYEGIKIDVSNTWVHIMVQCCCTTLGCKESEFNSVYDLSFMLSSDDDSDDDEIFDSDPEREEARRKILESQTHEEFIDRSLIWVNMIRKSAGLPNLE